MRGDKKQPHYGYTRRILSHIRVSHLQQHQEEAMEITAGDRAVSEMQPVSRQDETDLLGEE